LTYWQKDNAVQVRKTGSIIIVMKKMIIRIDDVGFSDVCNIGSFETIEKGLATSADVMLDSPGTDDALRRLKNFPWVSVGWHGHMWGTPVLPPSMVPSLIEKDGEFAGRFREDIRNTQDINYDEALSELRAQVKRCVDILGKVPDTCGAGGSSPWNRAVLEIADEYGIAHDFAVKKGTDPRVAERIRAAKERGEKWADYYQIENPERMKDQSPMERWKSRNIVIADGGLAYIDLLTDSVAWVEEQYDPVLYYTEDRAGLLKYGDEIITEQSWHPGYIDYYVYRLGERMNRPRARNFVVCRAQDVAALCSPRLRAWVKENNIELVNFRDALYGTREYQNYLKVSGSDLYVL
jgi:predicted glycoside hydrolase/deacetylase ChbG (UPF0249 family)